MLAIGCTAVINRTVPPHCQLTHVHMYGKGDVDLASELPYIAWLLTFSV